MMQGQRKLWAFVATQVSLLALGGMAVAWAPPAGIVDALTSIGATMSLALLYFCGGNAAEHLSKRPEAGAVAAPAPVTPPADDGGPR